MRGRSGGGGAAPLTRRGHAGSKKKLKERMAKVQPVWTKYFEMAAGEDDANGGDDARLEPIVENEEENIEIVAC